MPQSRHLCSRLSWFEQLERWARRAVASGTTSRTSPSTAQADRAGCGSSWRRATTVATPAFSRRPAASGRRPSALSAMARRSVAMWEASTPRRRRHCSGRSRCRARWKRAVQSCGSRATERRFAPCPLGPCACLTLSHMRHSCHRCQVRGVVRSPRRAFRQPHHRPRRSSAGRPALRVWPPVETSPLRRVRQGNGAQPGLGSLRKLSGRGNARGGDLRRGHDRGRCRYCAAATRAPCRYSEAGGADAADGSVVRARRCEGSGGVSACRSMHVQHGRAQAAPYEGV